MGIVVNKLNDLTIKSLPAGKHFDGGGLFLITTNSNPPSKLWRLKYRFASKEKLLSIGKYPDISLREARQKRDEAKSLIRQGLDPSSAKVKARKLLREDCLNTVEKCGNKWIAKMDCKWSRKTTLTIESLFKRDVYPFIGRKAFSEVTTFELLQIVQRVEDRGACFQAKRLLMRLGALCRWAVVNQLITINPASNLRSAEILKTYQVTHRKALAKEELSSFLTSAENYSGDVAVSKGLLFLTHTAMRPGEVRGLKWEDIDFEKSMLCIPAERMKMRRTFRVPLSSKAICILQEMKKISGHCELVFTSPVKANRPLSENTLNLAIRRLGYQATSHGMRSVFSTIANESQKFSPDLIEAALAHVDSNKIRSAYARSDYFDQRVGLMSWWSGYLETIKLPNRLATPNST